MAWIESHQEVARHPKTRRLALKLGVSRPTAIGHLHLLWWWALSFAQDGDLTDIEPEILAEEAMWDDEPAVFVQALRDSGWLVEKAGRLVINDWHEYAGKWIEARKKDAERKRAARGTSEPRPVDDGATSGGHPADIQATSGGCPGLPNLTVPNLTKPIVVAKATTPRAEPDEPSGTPKSNQRALFDVLVARFGQPANSAERGKFNKACKLFDEADCDSAEADLLIGVAEERWGLVEITPIGVAGNVTSLRGPARTGNGKSNGTGREGAVDQVRRLSGMGRSA